MSKKSTRDTRQQSRLVRGTKKGFTISTIDHLKDGKERLDATVSFVGIEHTSVVYAHPSEDYDHDAFFSAYTPEAEDGCYLAETENCGINVDCKEESVCWWHMSDGKVLGMHNGSYSPTSYHTILPIRPSLSSFNQMPLIITFPYYYFLPLSRHGTRIRSFHVSTFGISGGQRWDVGATIGSGG